MSSVLIMLMAVVFVFAPTSVSAKDDYRYSNCSASFRCGNLTDIGYPFYGGNRPRYCGYPGFELTGCSSQAPVINIQGLDYQVLNISRRTQTLQVARTDYSEDICSPSLQNTTLDNKLFDFTSDSENITFYYDCPQIPSNYTATSGLSTNISCNSSTDMTCYYITSDEAATGLIDSLRCSTNIGVPAYKSNIASMGKSLTQEHLVSTLSQGFGLQWKSLAEDKLCEDCSTSGGQCGYNETSNSFVCFCRNQIQQFSCLSSSTGHPRTEGKSRRKLAIIMGVSIAGAIAVGVGGAGCYYLYANTKTIGRKKKNHKQIEEIIRTNDSLIPKRWSYSEIKKMTNSFKEKLGEGGFGSVYKGKLQNGDVVAVKFLSKAKGDGEDFINEVASFSRTSHVNVVRLLGFCYEGSKRALVYEYMSNGSLDKFIYDQRSSPHKDHLKWDKLYEIAIGIARGLEYLHRGCATRIVHFDIKPNNILLDEDFSPKISDFGLAKLSKTRESRVSMLDARGTIGYIAPEVIYRNFGEVSYRADVYSYGMMVLEIIGARKNINFGASETYFPDWIYEHIESAGISRLHEIVAGAIAEDINDEERISKMMIVGLWCIQMYPSDRPSMTKVVEMLEGSLESLQVPPKPVSYSSVVRLSSPNSSTTASQITANIPFQHEENSSTINEL